MVEYLDKEGLEAYNTERDKKLETVNNKVIKEYQTSKPSSDGLLSINAITNDNSSQTVINLYNGTDGKYPTAGATAQAIKTLNDKIGDISSKVNNSVTKEYVDNNDVKNIVEDGRGNTYYHRLEFGDGTTKTVVQVADNLDDNNGFVALSAKQGIVLDNKIKDLDKKVDDFNIPQVIDNLESTSSTSALSANQGKILGELVGLGGIHSQKLDSDSGYIKFESGFMIQWKTQNVSGGGTLWANNIYYSDHAMGDWDEPFDKILTVIPSASIYQFWTGQSNFSTTSAGIVRVFRPNSSKNDVTVAITGFGTWK